LRWSTGKKKKEGYRLRAESLLQAGVKGDGNSSQINIYLAPLTTVLSFSKILLVMAKAVRFTIPVLGQEPKPYTMNMDGVQVRKWRY
jgi:hypothetical protein